MRALYTALTAALALVAAQAPAATVIIYSGTGHGTITKINSQNGTSTTDAAWFTYSFSYLVGGNCFQYESCGASSTGVGYTLSCCTKPVEQDAIHLYFAPGNPAAPDDETKFLNGSLYVNGQVGQFNYIWRSGTVDTVNISINDDAPQTAHTFFSANFTAVPEPASWALMITGLAMVGGSMRRRTLTFAFA